MPPVIPPVPGHDDEFFWAGVRDGRLLVQRCADCHELRHPPLPMCPHCRSLEWEAAELSGRGTIHSWVVSHHPSEPDAEPRVVVVVAMEEGVRLVSNLQGRAEDAAIDLPVEVVFEDFGDVVLPQFRVVAG
ncbi:MAG: hypothetical protein JWO37_3103 [Acidimicrobiales bacterium]|nr:hypothetical protein [Acidimicrobiales bacterium]